MQSIIHFFLEKVDKYADNTLLWEKADHIYTPTTYSETFEKVKQLALGLHKLGISKEEKIALLSEGRNLWLISELAVLSNRAITVPLSIKLEGDNDLTFRLQHSESTYIITSETQLSKIRAIKKDLTNLKKIIVLPTDKPLLEDEISIDVLFSTGKDILKNEDEAYLKLINDVKAEDIATITYTSGTTDKPKGIMLTQGNYTSNVEQAFSFIDIPSEYINLAVLPWDHAFAHTASLYAFIRTGASIASVQVGRTPMETLKNFANNMKEIQPHILMSVPAMAKNFKKNIEKNIKQKGNFTNNLFHFALKVAYWYNGRGNNKGKGLKFIAKPLLIIFDKILFSKIKGAFGGNLVYFIGGGALLDYDLQQFFYAIGTPMYQGYGLSEAAPIISANTPNYHKLGSSGKVVKDLEIKICDEDGKSLDVGQSGEIVIKGYNVMKGYWKNEEATYETIKDGWLHTGDLGHLDNEGYLYVTGRYKSLLISQDGEKYSPEGIEEAILDHCDSIDQIMLYNNQNAYTIAIIVPNIENIKNLHKQKYSSSDIIKSIEQELNIFKKHGKTSAMFPQRWLPSTFAIASEPFTEQNKLINSTMKMVRNKVSEYFQDEIDYCYTSEGKKVDNERNIANLEKLMM